MKKMICGINRKFPLCYFFIISLTAFTFFIIEAVKAGSLSPSASPAPTMYSLSDVYTRLTTNATATEGGHDLSSSASPASTMYTLTEVYEAIPTIEADKVKVGTSYLGVDGTLTPDGGTATTADIFNGKTSYITSDWNLDTGTLSLACNTSTFDGASNLVSDAYDGDGNGSNRWCMTDSGDATVSDILTGKTAWVDGQAATGTMANNGSFALTCSASDQSVTAGYYSGGTLSGDANLIAGNIKSGVNIFGVDGTLSSGYTYGDDSASKVLVTATGAGTALANLYNGTGQGFTGGTQADGGVDDYNNASSPATSRYEGNWTQCTSDNNYCGTGNSGADARDDSTGLVWSKALNSFTYAFDDTAGAMTWFIANNCQESSGSVCTKKTSSKTGCEATEGWSLPHQKQLMQAYIDGSYGNLETSGVTRGYWSATTNSYDTTGAWYTLLSYGYTTYNSKTTTRSVRCVLFLPGN